MATLTISLSGSAIVNGSKSWTVSDVDVQTLINYAARRYAGPGAAPLAAAPALAAWAQSFVDQTKTDVQRDSMKNVALPTPLIFT